MEQYMEEALKYYTDAEEEFKQEHYHLAVGNLMYALHILKTIGKFNDELVGKTYYLLCKTHAKLKHYEKSHDVWEKCYQFYLKRDIYKIGDLYNVQALIYTETKKDERAIASYQKTIDLLKDDQSDQAFDLKLLAYYNLSNCYARIGDEQSAKENYIKIYKELKIRGEKYNSARGKILMAIGCLYHYKNQTTMAGRYYMLAKKYIDPEQDGIAYGRLVHNLGEVYLEKGMLGETRKLFEESIALAGDGSIDKLCLTSSFVGLAYTYLEKDMEKLKDHSVEALNLAMNNVSTKFGDIEEQELGRIFLLFCHWLYHEGRLDDAKIYYKQAENILRRHGMAYEIQILDKFKETLKGGEAT